MTTGTRMRPAPPASWDDVIERFQRWALETDAVQGMLVVGSRARADRPADQWYDLDLLIVTDDRDHTILDDTWPIGIGQIWATLAHPRPLPDAPVRQVAFEGGYDVEIVALPPERLHGGSTDGVIADLLARGHRLLVDKDDQLHSLPMPRAASSATLPDPEELLWSSTTCSSSSSGPASTSGVVRSGRPRTTWTATCATVSCP